MQHSETIGKLAEALSKAQGTFTHVSRDGKSHHGKYATLNSVYETVRAGLAENGLSIVQGPGTDGNMVTVTTRLMHGSGEWMETTMSAPGNQDVQKLGSSISYLRRYSLMAMLSLAADDDDDGNASLQPSGKQGATPQKAASTPRQAPPRSEVQPVSAEAPTEAPIGKENGSLLHGKLGAILQNTSKRELSHAAFAAEVLGRAVGSLADLTRSEAAQVQAAARSIEKAEQNAA